MNARPWFIGPLAFVALTIPAVLRGVVLQSELEARTVATTVGGVHVIHRSTSRDIAVVRLFLLGGVRQLTEQTAGIEALALRGAAFDARDAIAGAACRLHLDPGLDWTVIGFTCLDQDVAAGWAAFAGLLAPQNLTEASVDRAREELLSAARRRNSHPDLHVNTLAMRNAFTGHPYRINPLGNTRSLRSLTRDDLIRYVNETFVQSRMLLVAVGGQPDAVTAAVESTIAQLPIGNYEWRLPPPMPARRSSWAIEHRTLPTAYILGYFAGPSPRDRDYFAFQVATTLLSGQLQYYVRSRRSLSYAAYAPFLDQAAPAGGLYASSSNPDETLPLMIEVIESLQSIDARGRTWRRFLDQYTLDELAQNMTSEGQADALGRAYLLLGDHTFADERAQRLRRVRAREVRSAARKYMRHIQYAFLGDTTLMRRGW